MGTLATIAAVVLGMSFFTFVAFFGRLPVLRYVHMSLIFYNLAHVLSDIPRSPGCTGPYGSTYPTAY